MYRITLVSVRREDTLQGYPEKGARPGDRLDSLSQGPFCLALAAADRADRAQPFPHCFSGKYDQPTVTGRGGQEVLSPDTESSYLNGLCVSAVS